ncbi:MAG: DUF4350 domain-containing protein [Verrucomicrobiota bacterium]
MRVLHLRMERGDVFPESSSLRMDPLGSRALAEAFEAVPSIDVERNFEDWTTVELDPEATFYVFRSDPYTVFRPVDRGNRVLEYVSRGGRLIYTDGSSNWYRERQAREVESDDELDEDHEDFIPIEQEEDSEEDSLALEEVIRDWVLDDSWQLEVVQGDREVTLAQKTAFGDGPDEIAWIDRSYFDSPPEGWTVVYESMNGPVVLQREYLRGDIIAISDAYLFSNEALLNDRESSWLAWIQGGRKRAIFDEWHFGVAEPTGIAILMRRYQLGGLALALAFTATLFVWRNVYGLTPTHEGTVDHSAGVVRLGGTAQTGLKNLLRRAIAPADLFAVCVERFNKHCSAQVQRSPSWKKAKAEIDAVVSAQVAVPPRKRTPIAAYRELVKILSKYRIHLK